MKLSNRSYYVLSAFILSASVGAFWFTNYQEHKKIVREEQSTILLASKTPMSSAISSAQAVISIRKSNPSSSLFLLTNLKSPIDTAKGDYNFYLFASGSHQVQAIEYIYEDSGLHACSYALALPRGKFVHMETSSIPCAISPLGNGGKWVR